MTWKVQIFIGLTVSIVSGMIMFFVQSTFDGNSQLSKKTQQEYVHQFLNVVNKYCVDYRNKLDSLANYLENEQGFNKTFWPKGTYETTVNGISMAISPEDKYCTTDLLLKQFDNTLFEYDQIDNLIRQRTGLDIKSSKKIEDTDRQGNQVQVIQTVYTTDTGEKWILVYPYDHLDTYFLTIDVYCSKC